MSKINIEVDAGYAFDYFAILVIKFSNDLIDESILEDCVNDLTNQLGEDFYDEIVSSEEFEDLILHNLKTFNLVEIARKQDTGLAHEVDKANLDRYNAKVALQKKFFGSDMTIEKKS